MEDILNINMQTKLDYVTDVIKKKEERKIIINMVIKLILEVFSKW